VRKSLIFGLIFILALSAACGGGGEKNQVRSESKQVNMFLDDIVQRGDLSAAFEKMTGPDRAGLGTLPGFYDFITGKESEAMSEEFIIAQVAVREFTPVPENLFRYEVGEPEGQGDTVMVPVTFYVPSEDMETFFKENIDPDLYDQLDNMDNAGLTLEQKKELITRGAKEVRDAIKGKTFEMDVNTNRFMVVREDGKWKVSFLGSGLMGTFGGM
jgi:hypothetical protein